MSEEMSYTQKHAQDGVAVTNEAKVKYVIS